MNKFVVNKDSWHFKWAMYNQYIKKIKFDEFDISGYPHMDFRAKIVYDYLEPKHIPRDFCSYWRLVLLWPLIHVLLSIPAIYIIFATLFYSVITGSVILSLGVIVFCAALLGIFGAIFWMSDVAKNAMKNWWKKLKSDKSNKSENGFVFTAYKSYKENMCPIVEYDKEIKK